MKAQYLLDTSICIYVRQEAGASFAPLSKTGPGEAALAVITYGELLYGATKSSQRTLAREQLRDLLHWLPALSLPETAAEAYGNIRFDLESKGEMIGNNDLWIAAHAVTSGLTLVTNNEKEFRRVRGLRLQNWAS